MSSYSNQNNLLLDNLIKFYNKNDNLQKMLNIINGQSYISLRIVDWFATNYAKQKFTTYNLKNGNRFKVYNDYKLKLRSYSKKRFDPFCRWERITIPYHDNTSIQTTIGQLNFFKWAIDNLVIEYIKNNYEKIEEDMNTSIKKPKNTNSQSKARKKRQELSKSASRGLNKNNVTVKITFD